MQRPFTGQTLSLRQTDCREPSRSHGYQFVSTYHIMTSSTPPCSFFRGLYFCGSRSVRENLHPVKISCYTVLLLHMAKWTMYTTITWVNHTSSCSCHGSEKMLVNAVVVLESTQKRIFGWQIIQVEGQDITFIVYFFEHG